MTLKRSAVTALLSSMIVFATSAQSNSNRSQTLFTINKKPVSTGEFIYLYRKNHQHKPEEFTEEKIEEYLTLFINYKLKVEEALSRGMDTTASFKKEYQTYHDELLKPYLPDSRVIDSMVMLTYGRLKEEVNASHILIALQPDASPADTLEAFNKISVLRDRALAEEDFGKLAAQFSEEPGASSSEGNLGFFTAMQMVFPFEQAAWVTPVGGISKPVRTQFGYHIVKVLDRQPSRGEVEVSHIMIRTGDRVDNENVKNTIFDIYDQLQKGMKWEDLCQQYSEDPNSKDRGGRLRPFGVGGMAAVPQFQEMAFALEREGQISDPVQTQFGWHILRLESKIPVPPYDEIKATLTQRVSRDERVQISRKALRERMRAELGFVEKGAVKSALIQHADSILSGSHLSGLEEQTLFTMQNKPFQVRDFLEYAAGHKKGPGLSASAYLDQLFLQYVEAVQLQLLEEKIKRESPDYKWLLKEYYEGILLFEIMEKEVWNKAMEDSTGQKTYFERHSSHYNAGERMAGKIYSSQSKEYLWKLKELTDQQDASLPAFTAENRIREDKGIFKRTDRPLFSEISWAPGAHLTSDRGMHYLVVIEKLLPSGPETFEEARASVISDYQTWLEEMWIADLKGKFTVKVEKKTKKRAFRELMGN
ncbi:MAG: peptidylprolyl isomerase [Cyclobacteriaceae bacterium]